MNITGNQTLTTEQLQQQFIYNVSFVNRYNNGPLFGDVSTVYSNASIVSQTFAFANVSDVNSFLNTIVYTSEPWLSSLQYCFYRTSIRSSNWCAIISD